MALSIDSNIKLSIPSAFSRDPIVDLLAGHGIERLYKSQNTLIDKLRGPLICDEDIELSTTGQSGVYRVRVHGDGGGVSGGEPAEAHVNVSVKTGGSMTARFATGIGSITQAISPVLTNQWVTFASSLYIDDTAEYEEVTVDLSAVAGTATLHSVGLHYLRGRAALLDGPRTDGLTGMDASRATGESVLSSARLHHLHLTHRNLIKIRQGTIIQRAFYDDTNGYQPLADGFLMWVAYAPPGVTEGRFYLRRNAGAAGTSDWTLKSLDMRLNILDTETESGIGTSPGWTTARDLDLVPGLNLITLEASVGTAKIHTISGWLKDATYG